MMFCPQIHKDGMPPGITLIERDDSVAGDWFVDIQVLDENPLYKAQIYRLKFHFPKMYPIGPSICLQCCNQRR